MDDLLSMFSNMGTDDHEAMINQFMKVMRCEKDVARFFLESSGWHVEKALNAFLSTVGTRNNIYQPGSFEPPQAIFDESGTVPPGQKFPPSSLVNVVWRWKNVGTSPWPPDVCLIHVDGLSLGGPNKPVSLSCDAGQITALPIVFKTPDTPGEYGGCWRLTCASGYFGEPIWVILSVQNSVATAAEDMAAAAFTGLGQGTMNPVIGNFNSMPPAPPDRDAMNDSL